ncbi:MAG: hypothetical protein KatS3mg076_0582 [Candidatus Binatia bacterium]|nr:MAG: hypothetical protein KatS3mg076_0582 [Candidatus Binatia bacterium]
MAVGFALLVLLCVTVANAHIYEWRDAQGVRHYTNSVEAVPEDRRETVRLVVEEKPPGKRPAPEAAHEPPAPGPVPAAAAPLDPERIERAYVQGWLEGLLVAERLAAETRGVDLRLRVSNLAVAPPSHVPVFVEPLVTTSFDRGRSRHLTLRLLLQEQFALDREAPFVFRERFFPPRHHPGIAPHLHPFLARGLPHVRPPRIRVVTR